MKTNIWSRFHNLDKVELGYFMFAKLPLNIQEYIAKCVHYEVPNPPSAFKEGDIVIRTFGDQETIDTDPYGVPIKWRVVCCAYGAVIGRKILGKKLGEHEAVNNFGIPGCRAKIDPDYLNSLILQDDTFDPDERRKKSIKERRAAAKYNRSISRKIKNTQDAHNFINAISVGSIIYISRSLIGLTTSPRRLTVVDKPYSQERCWTELVVKHSKDNFGGFEVVLTPPSLVGCFITTQEPYPISKIIQDETI